MARKVWEEQLVFQWPGLAAEAEYIARELNVESVMDTELSKKEYRESVTEACHRYDEKMLKEKMENKKKCARIVQDEYGRKEYFAKLIPGEGGTTSRPASRCCLWPGTTPGTTASSGQTGSVSVARERSRNTSCAIAANTTTLE